MYIFKAYIKPQFSRIKPIEGIAHLAFLKAYYFTSWNECVTKFDKLIHIFEFKKILNINILALQIIYFHMGYAK